MAPSTLRLPAPHDAGFKRLMDFAPVTGVVFALSCAEPAIFFLPHALIPRYVGLLIFVRVVTALGASGLASRPTPSSTFVSFFKDSKCGRGAGLVHDVLGIDRLARVGQRRLVVVVRFAVRHRFVLERPPNLRWVSCASLHVANLPAVGFDGSAPRPFGLSLGLEG